MEHPSRSPLPSQTPSHDARVMAVRIAQRLQRHPRMLVLIDAEAQRRSLFFETATQLQRRARQKLLLLVPDAIHQPSQRTRARFARESYPPADWSSRLEANERMRLASLREVQLQLRAPTATFPYAAMLIYELPPEPSLLMQQVLAAIPKTCRLAGFCLTSKPISPALFGFQTAIDARSSLTRP